MSTREFAGWLAGILVFALLAGSAFHEALKVHERWDRIGFVSEYRELRRQPPLTFAQWQARGYR